MPSTYLRRRSIGAVWRTSGCSRMFALIRTRDGEKRIKFASDISRVISASTSCSISSGRFSRDLTATILRSIAIVLAGRISIRSSSRHLSPHGEMFQSRRMRRRRSPLGSMRMRWISSLISRDIRRAAACLHLRGSLHPCSSRDSVIWRRRGFLPSTTLSRIGTAIHRGVSATHILLKNYCA